MVWIVEDRSFVDPGCRYLGVSVGGSSRPVPCMICEGFLDAGLIDNLELWNEWLGSQVCGEPYH